VSRCRIYALKSSILVLLIHLFKDNLPLFCERRDTLAYPFQLVFQILERPRQPRTCSDSFLTDVSEFHSSCPWLFSRFCRVKSNSSWRIRDFVDFTGRHDIVDARSTGLQENLRRTVELKEKLVTCTVSSCAKTVAGGLIPCLPIRSFATMCEACAVFSSSTSMCLSLTCPE
jgi:hypothetical protein